MPWSKADSRTIRQALTQAMESGRLEGVAAVGRARILLWGHELDASPSAVEAELEAMRQDGSYDRIRNGYLDDEQREEARAA